MLQMMSIANKSKKPVLLELSISCQHPPVKFSTQIPPFEKQILREGCFHKIQI